MKNIRRLLSKQIFTNKDIASFFDNPKKASYWCKKACEEKIIFKIHKGLYATMDPVFGGFYSPAEVIACNLADDAYISHHSAMSYHGYANQVYRTYYVATKKRFLPVECDEISFERVEPHFYEGVELLGGLHRVRVTNLERTIIDCLDDLGHGGGMEELINFLDFLDNVDEEKLLKYLSLYNKKVLYQKAGYTLRHYQKYMHISEGFFDECRKHIGKCCYKFVIRDFHYEHMVFFKEWNIIAPRTLFVDEIGEHFVGEEEVIF